MEKVALVSGASGGIGAACCKRLAASGFCIAALYHKNESAAEALVRDITASGGKAAAFCCDIRDSGAVGDTVKAVQGTLGGVDVLVGCAGVSRQRLFQDITDEAWAQMRGVHLDGAFYLTRAVLPEMLRKKQGRIIHIASMWGETGGSCEVGYSASKAALIGLTKAAAKELGPSDIRVNCVSPGMVDTDMTACLSAEAKAEFCSALPPARAGTPAEVAEAVLFLAKQRFMTGEVLRVNGGCLI